MANDSDNTDSRRECGVYEGPPSGLLANERKRTDLPELKPTTINIAPGVRKKLECLQGIIQPTPKFPAMIEWMVSEELVRRDVDPETLKSTDTNPQMVDCQPPGPGCFGGSTSKSKTEGNDDNG